MEISPLMIYIIGLVDKLQNLFETVLYLSFFVSPLLLLFIFNKDGLPEVIRKNLSWSLKFVISAILISAIGLTTIPTSKTLIAMYVIPPIANSQVVHEIPDVLLDFVKAYVGNLKKEDDV